MIKQQSCKNTKNKPNANLDNGRRRRMSSVQATTAINSREIEHQPLRGVREGCYAQKVRRRRADMVDSLVVCGCCFCGGEELQQAAKRRRQYDNSRPAAPRDKRFGGTTGWGHGATHV